MTQPETSLHLSPLNDLHVELGAKMVPFAGYSMPVNYPAGILAEHRQCREKAALFDVSHMGQVVLSGIDVAAKLETLVPADIVTLAPGRMRYTQFTNDQGGILDDLMVANDGGHLFLVVNASRKAHDVAHMKAHLEDLDVTVEELSDRALLALQGPQAETVLARFASDCAAMAFMDYKTLVIGGFACLVSRSGYTGEDGFEISVPKVEAEHLARLLLAEPDVAPAGLGARDSLRLEAGLCLYGSDIDETTTPIEANLAWSIQKRRRAEGGFPGAAVIQRQLAEGVSRKRVGLKPDGKAPARAHTLITDENGREIGEITSGGFGPSIGAPIAMGYVETASSAAGRQVKLMVRGKALDAKVVDLPFVKQSYKR